MLYRMAGEPVPGAPQPFGDVEAGAYYDLPSAWAYENGIVNGYGDGLFGPKAEVTREQFVTMLFRYAASLGLGGLPAGGDSVLDGFQDETELSGFAADPMKWAVAAGLIEGFEDRTLRPKDSLSREQLAVLIRRFDEFLTERTAAEPKA